MKKIKLELLFFTGFIIAVFFCSSFLTTPISNRMVDQNSNSSGVIKSATNLGSSNLSGDQWSMMRGNVNNTGVTETTPVAHDGPIWKYQTNFNIWSGPAVANGLVYCGNMYFILFCLNETTGASVWNYTTGGSIHSTPAIANGMVYVGSADHNLYCLNATTGKHIWTFGTADAIYSSPTVVNGMVIVGSEDDYVYCINATDGSQIWSYETGNKIDFSSPAVVNGMVYIGSTDHRVYCLNATDGTQIWNYTSGFPFEVSPAVANGMVYAGCNDFNLYGLNATTGTQIWNYTGYSAIESSPAVENGMVYYQDAGGGIYCINATTGAYIWCNVSSSSVYNCGSPIIANGFLYIGTTDDTFYCLNATTGTILWSYHAEGYSNFGFQSEGALASGMVFAGDSLGFIYCFPMITTPSAPLNLNLTVSSNNTQITLKWQAPSMNGGSAVTGYNIYRGTSNGTETLLKSVGNVLTYNDTGLTINKTYFYEVSAINAVGEGSKSTEINATTISNSTNTNSSNIKIGGMGIGVILSVSSLGVMISIVSVKKRMKKELP